MFDEIDIQRFLNGEVLIHSVGTLLRMTRNELGGMQRKSRFRDQKEVIYILSAGYECSRQGVIRSSTSWLDQSECVICMCVDILGHKNVCNFVLA